MTKSKNGLIYLDENSEAISDFFKKSQIQGDAVNSAIKKINDHEKLIGRAREKFISDGNISRDIIKTMEVRDNALKISMQRIQDNIGNIFSGAFAGISNKVFDQFHGASTLQYEYKFSNPDMVAAIALLGYLESASNDSEIKNSEKISGVIADLLKTIRGLDCNTSSDLKSIYAAIGFTARSSTNTENARKKRLTKEYELAADRCKTWFSKPDTYKNKAHFKRDICEALFCKDLGTASRWLGEFIRNLDPGEAWLEKFGPKKTG